MGRLLRQVDVNPTSVDVNPTSDVSDVLKTDRFWLMTSSFNHRTDVGSRVRQFDVGEPSVIQHTLISMKNWILIDDVIIQPTNRRRVEGSTVRRRWTIGYTTHTSEGSTLTEIQASHWSLQKPINHQTDVGSRVRQFDVGFPFLIRL